MVRSRSPQQAFNQVLGICRQVRRAITRDPLLIVRNLRDKDEDRLVALLKGPRTLQGVLEFLAVYATSVLRETNCGHTFPDEESLLALPLSMRRRLNHEIALMFEAVYDALVLFVCVGKGEEPPTKIFDAQMTARNKGLTHTAFVRKALERREEVASLNR